MKATGRIIQIAYWHSKLNNTPWEHGDEFRSNSKKEFRNKLYKILSRIEDSGYNAMILHHKYCIITTVFINDGIFEQL